MAPRLISSTRGRRGGARLAASTCSCNNGSVVWNALPARRERCRRMQGQDRGPADRSERSVPGSCRSLLGGDRSVRLQAGSYADSPNGADGATRLSPFSGHGQDAHATTEQGRGARGGDSTRWCLRPRERPLAGARSYEAKPSPRTRTRGPCHFGCAIPRLTPSGRGGG